MWDYLQNLTKTGTTILLTTHYLEEAEQLAKHVAIVNKGAIVAEGTMDELLATYEEKNHGKYKAGKLESIFLSLTSDVERGESGSKLPDSRAEETGKVSLPNKK